MLERHVLGEGLPVLLLAGEPGIGKTRLRWEAAAVATSYDWQVLRGGCQRRGDQEPCPLVEALDEHMRRQELSRPARELQGCCPGAARPHWRLYTYVPP